ncbi:MAG: hypothetical protein ACK4FG_07045 [Brevundimonas sp.]
MSDDANKTPDVKGGRTMKSTDSFLVLGFVFLVLGMTGDNNATFLILGMVFLIIGAGARFRSGKGGPK